MTGDDAILDIVELLIDAVGLSQAMLEKDFCEARFRARLIASKAPAMGLDDVHVAASKVVCLLGTGDQPPGPGHALAIMALSSKIESSSAFLRG